MTERIQSLRGLFITRREHHAFRQPPLPPYRLAEQYAASHMDPLARELHRLQFVLDEEKPVVFPEERIAFLRTVPVIPELFTEQELEALTASRRIHEKGNVCNICVDYTKLLSCGFARKREELSALRDRFQAEDRPEQARYAQGQLDILVSLGKLAERYRLSALEAGNTTVADTLSRVPEQPPATLAEALQMLRILHYAMWCGRNYHNTFGRFDQYMLPYLRRDLEAGLLTEEGALELIEEFFLSCNRDSDLYPGMQQGDNGQSMVLGGRLPDGTDGYNLLSELCLKACLELRLIDPKLNLRVSRDTPLPVYELGTELTRQGLGFPQYANDDVIIDGLVRLGYAPEDACNYVVAACWEFIIPGRGMDIPNIDALSLAEMVENAVLEHLTDCGSYEALFSRVCENIRAETARMRENTNGLYLFPAPFLSLMMEGCGENGRDVSEGCRYHNYGFHGTGLATAADSLAAVRRYVYETGEVSKEELLDALKSNFEGHDRLLHRLRFEAPKLGNNDDAADSIACALLDAFADALEGFCNDRGGIFRAGTGSAMYYLWHSERLPATPDGRRRGEPLSANYSPSLFARLKGPVSIFRSFAKPCLRRAVNGGPLTLELHDTLFRSPESVRKVAAAVKSYMDIGGHQLQLNAVNRETMLEAQKHPESHRGLIVRVWGWSGYFVELDREYQDHIIQRTEWQL